MIFWRKLDRFRFATSCGVGPFLVAKRRTVLWFSLCFWISWFPFKSLEAWTISEETTVSLRCAMSRCVSPLFGARRCFLLVILWFLFLLAIGDAKDVRFRVRRVVSRRAASPRVATRRVVSRDDLSRCISVRCAALALAWSWAVAGVGAWARRTRLEMGLKSLRLRAAQRTPLEMSFKSLRFEAKVWEILGPAPNFTFLAVDVGSCPTSNTLLQSMQMLLAPPRSFLMKCGVAAWNSFKCEDIAILRVPADPRCEDGSFGAFGSENGPLGVIFWVNLMGTWSEAELRTLNPNEKNGWNPKP